MTFRNEKTAVLIANQCMSCIQMAYDHAMVAPEVRDRLFYLAKNSMSEIVTQLCAGTISQREFFDMEKDITDLFTSLLCDT